MAFVMKIGQSEELFIQDASLNSSPALPFDRVARRGPGFRPQVGGIGAESVHAEQDGDHGDKEEEKRQDAPLQTMAHVLLLVAGPCHDRCCVIDGSSVEKC